MAVQAFADEHDLTDELYAEDLTKDRTTRQLAFVDPDDEAYDWTTSR